MKLNNMKDELPTFLNNFLNNSQLHRGDTTTNYSHFTAKEH